MFLEAEKGQAIWGRVRAMLGETAADGSGKEKGVARRVAEVWVAGWEKGRWEAEAERMIALYRTLPGLRRRLAVTGAEEGRP